MNLNDTKGSFYMNHEGTLYNQHQEEQEFKDNKETSINEGDTLLMILDRENDFVKIKNLTLNEEVELKWEFSSYKEQKLYAMVNSDDVGSEFSIRIR